MSLTVYNTLAREKQEFEPIDPNNVRMYVCGPTVYDYAHIGNARPVVVFDVLFRLLSQLYGEAHVTYARNITDVEDKILERVQAEGVEIGELTARTTEAFHADMAALGALPPTVEPRATEHIPGMVAMIEKLIADGHAYAAEGHVLFSVPSMPDYGRLSRLNREEQIDGARVEVAPYKKDPADFVLWKPSSDDQPGWDSPWGRGRPGWHIECSAMSEAHFGETFDIHGGGLDLIFPHHENEIAQSTCAHDGRLFVKYWMHNGYVVVGGEKMSKSLGNFFTVRQLLEEGFRGEAIRLTLLSGHYRQPLDVTRDKITEAKRQLDGFYGALDEVSAIEAEQSEPDDEVLAALEDDLNTPLALAKLHRLRRELNKAGNDAHKARVKGRLLASAALLGLLWDDPGAWFRGSEGPGEGESVLSAEEIEALIEARREARAARNFEEADRIRDDLTGRGIILEDSPSGTTWKRAH